MRLSEAELRDLRHEAEIVRNRRSLRFMEVDPRVLLRMLDEIANQRVVMLTIERTDVDPALRD